MLMQQSEENSSLYDEKCKEEWAKLDEYEKKIVILYKSYLLANGESPSGIAFTVNDIHNKYKDFHMGCVP
jgi:hypothetical protein